MVTYALQMIPYLNLLVKSTSNVENNIVAVERIQHYNKTIQEPEPQILEGDDWPSNGKIEFEDYSNKYQEGEEEVLKKVNLCVEGGTKTSVIGRSGAGKTSLVLSLFRLA